MATQRIRRWRGRFRGMSLRMGSINAENGGAIVGEEKASKWALGGVVRQAVGDSAGWLVSTWS